MEDEQFTRSLIENLLQQEGFEVKACGNAEAAAALVRDFDPDALVVDISLGEGPTGIDLIYALSHGYPHLAFVVLSNYSALPASLDNLTKVAYLRKRDVADPRMLIQAIEDVLRDTDPSKSFPIEQLTVLSKLTTRQLEVLSLIASGLTNQEIAHRRGTTVESTEQLIGRIYKSLGLRRDSAKSMRVQASAIYTAITGAG